MGADGTNTKQLIMSVRREKRVCNCCHLKGLSVKRGGKKGGNNQLAGMRIVLRLKDLREREKRKGAKVGRIPHTPAVFVKEGKRGRTKWEEPT